MKIIINKKDIPNLNLEGINKFWEREYSPFTMSSYETTAQIINSLKFGVNNISIAVFIYRNGTTSQYRSFEKQGAMNESLTKKLTSNPIFKKKLVAAYVYHAEKLKKAFSKIENKDNFNTMFIRKFNEDFGKLTAYVIPIQRCVDYMKDFPEYKKIYIEFVELRKKYEYIFGGTYEKYLKLLSEKVSRAKNFQQPSLLKLLTVDEFVFYLENNALPEDINERENLSVILLGSNTSLLLSKDAAKSISDKIECQENKSFKENDSILKGMTVYNQNITGIVQVISDFKKLDKFVEGNILVVPSTLPKYEPYYRKAKGIITDEGGVLSHAAIFCREFKIPGIIATHIATKVLKTGDRVEMDTTRGIINKQ